MLSLIVPIVIFGPFVYLLVQMYREDAYARKFEDLE